MLLFQNYNDDKDLTTYSVVISARQSVLDMVSVQLEIRNFDNLTFHQVHPDNFDVASLPASIKYLIFDMEDSGYAEDFISKIELMISKETVCVAIGNRDSIVLSGQYQLRGVHYILNQEGQITALGSIFDSQVELLKWIRTSMKVCVLSCKGGIGGSSLTYHLGNSLIEQRNMSLLAVQGMGGTRNFDLISKKDIADDVTKIQENFSVMYEEKQHRWDFTVPLYNNFDFVLFDHTLYNADSVEIENALTHANCIILICNANLASLRNAKKFLDHEQHLKSTISGVKKIIVCFNENQPKVIGAINKNEAASLLGRPIDIAIPYMRNSGDPSLPLLFSGQNKAIIQQLTHLTLGRKADAFARPLRKGFFNLSGK